MSLGLSNDDPNPNRHFAFFSGVCEAVIPLEIQIPSLRVVLTNKITDGDNNWLCLQKLEALEEKQLQAQQCIELYQARISKAFNKRVRESLPEKTLGLSCQATHDHDTQN